MKKVILKADLLLPIWCVQGIKKKIDTDRQMNRGTDREIERQIYGQMFVTYYL